MMNFPLWHSKLCVKILLCSKVNYSIASWSFLFNDSSAQNKEGWGLVRGRAALQTVQHLGSVFLLWSLSSRFKFWTSCSRNRNAICHQCCGPMMIMMERISDVMRIRHHAEFSVIGIWNRHLLLLQWNSNKRCWMLGKQCSIWK